MSEIFQYEPNWLVSAFVGALIGFILPYVAKVIYAMPKLISKHYLCGCWNHYYVTYKDGSRMIVNEKLKISQGLKERLKAKSIDSSGRYVLSKGDVVFEKDFVVIRVQSTRHKEMAFIRFPVPYPDEKMTMVGVSLAQDFNGLAAVGVNILSTKELSDIEINACIDKYIDINVSVPLIRALKEEKLNKALHKDSQQVAHL